MAFRKVERRPSGAGAVAQEFVKARCWGKRFELLFSEDLWMLMGSPSRIGILIGEGPDKGKIAIEPDEASGYHCNRAAPKAHVRRIYVSRDKIGVEPFPSRILKHRMKGERLVIDLDMKPGCALKQEGK